MTDWSIPSIPRLNWEINGNFMTAWVSDDEVMTITPSDDGLGMFRLSIASLAHVTSVFLGDWPSLTGAQRVADRHIGDEEST